jgi:hypothetical protein
MRGESDADDAQARLGSQTPSGTLDFDTRYEQALELGNPEI